jgi:leader peptidase (prepilin peptidase)/N-methyltransferase
VQSIFGGALAVLLLTLAYCDLRWMILPDKLNAALAAGGLLQSLIISMPDPIDSGLGALCGGMVLGAVAYGFHRLRGYHGLGLGDVKFASAAGFWIGWQGVPLMVLSASLAGLVAAAVGALRSSRLDLRAKLPFGPFLCAGTLLAWLSMVTA